ncbi:hypothetical protein [Streptomyces sp. NPDC059080]|uniref:hypothetical protein n=1 Tax=Streptomyces sp. NPDC059080 TaxID=3346718 RepID=UPI0036AC1F07
MIHSGATAVPVHSGFPSTSIRTAHGPYVLSVPPMTAAAGVDDSITPVTSSKAVNSSARTRRTLRISSFGGEWPYDWGEGAARRRVPESSG